MSLPIHHIVDGAPRPVAPFSHAVEAEGFVFVTGQMPTDPDAPDAPLPGGVEAQTRRVFDNLRIVLGGLGLGVKLCWRGPLGRVAARGPGVVGHDQGQHQATHDGQTQLQCAHV